jgi:outer membrane protein insertion porin family
VANLFTLTRDSRDYIFNPSSGSYLVLRTEIAKKFLFANVDYNRFTFEARTYFPLFWKFIIMARMKAGFVTGADEVPLYKRFYVGGVGENGVRGYPDRSLTPELNGQYTGGNAMYVNNIELKLKVSQGLAFLVFYDAGKAFPSYRDVNFYDLSRGAGTGIRIEIPLMGLLGFDMGYGFDRPQPGWEAHFQINPFGIF